jgi:peptidoglycan/LPS O-acetylase OafA/YrhL
MLKHESHTATRRLALVDALRALTATAVAWHHFVLYGPVAHWAVPDPGAWITWLRDYRWFVQVFFAVGGYVMARSMAPRVWNLRQSGLFVVRRYCRLGLPYLAAIAVAIAACALGRGWLSESFVGAPPRVAQILAHVVFLQDILGYESLSAGLWFVCIDFQLGLICVAMMWLRDAIGPRVGLSQGDSADGIVMVMAWPLAAASLFYFNMDSAWDPWAIYFFAQFFMGVMVYFGLRSRRFEVAFWLYVAMMVVAVVYSWRWRVAMSLSVGLLLYVGGKLGFMDRWPRSRIVASSGRTSYSLFLLHFPVFVVVSTIWVRLDWSRPWEATAALLVAYAASLAAAELFYRGIETPAVRLSRSIS